MKKNLAVLGCTLTHKEVGITGADPVPTTLPSTKNRADGKNVYKKEIKVVISGQSFGACVQTAPVNATINSSSTKNRIEGDPVMREDDEALPVTINGTAPGPVACSFPYTAYIKEAGQDKQRCE